jgi:transposase-like protein
MRRKAVDVDEIVRLYVEEGLRGSEIARRVGCSASLVYSRLDSAGVRRSRLARLPREDVVAAYLDGVSTVALAKRYGVAPKTISWHLRNSGVALRGHAESLQPRNRVPCPRAAPVRAYLLGFVWGDLAVYPPQGKGRTISVSGSTTHDAQCEVVLGMFEPFGKVSVWRQQRHRSIWISLDSSFDFLLAKYGATVPAWVRGAVTEAAFAAGYIDAEGSFGVYDGRARFKLDSCDLAVHQWLHGWLQSIGVPFVGRKIESSGVRSNGLRLNHDLYRVNVNDALGLRRLVATIDAFSRHSTRRATMAAAVQNVDDRMRARAAV